MRSVARLGNGVAAGQEALLALVAKAKAWSRSLAEERNGTAIGDAAAAAAPDSEDDRIAALAAQWGTTPILVEDDLKYEGMQPLTDKPLLDWVARNAGNRLCVRAKRGDNGVLAWIITDQPNSAAVEATTRLLAMKGRTFI